MTVMKAPFGDHEVSFLLDGLSANSASRFGTEEMSVGKRLRKARQDAGYTSAIAFVAAHGLERTIYSRHESGLRQIDRHSAERYAAALGNCSAAWLLFGDSESGNSFKMDQAPSAEMTAGERLRKARKEAGYKSADAFAAAQGFKRTTYSGHEAGRREMDRHSAKWYATALANCSAAWLFFGVPNSSDSSKMNEAPEGEEYALSLYRLLHPDERLRWLEFGRALLAADKARNYAPPRPSQMTSIRFSPAQRRALEWLPASGEWRSEAGRLAAALKSLSNLVPNVFEYRNGHYGPRGCWCQQWRLTDEGRNLRASVFPESI